MRGDKALPLTPGKELLGGGVVKGRRKRLKSSPVRFFRKEHAKKAGAASGMPLDLARLREGSKVEKSAAGALQGF